MNLSFENKVALVTGAGMGMGLATAKAFAEAGAAVVLTDVNEDTIQAAGEELVSAGHKVLVVRCNVADEAEVAAMIEQTVSTFGRLDTAFNNAGIMIPAVETADSSGIRINAVCPGTIETPMVATMMAKESITREDFLRDLPIGRLGRPEEIASAVL